ncbi:tetratricopeptide repeat protein, partial [bacterium]|nr:tetratricopeptide repeat protein [bacterium]
GRSYMKKNSLLVMNGRAEEAVKNYQDLIKEDPKEPDYYFGLAGTLFSMNRLDGAKKEIDKALILEPLKDDYRLLAGKIDYLSNDYFNAINHLTNCLILNNRFLEAYYYLAKAYDKTGKSIEALKALEVAIAMEPLYFDARLELSSIKFRQLLKQSKSFERNDAKKDVTKTESKEGVTSSEEVITQYTQLVSELEEALKIMPASIEGNLLLSRIFYTMGAVYKARKVLENHLGNFKRDDKIVLEFSEIEYKAGNYEKAFSLLSSIENQSLKSKILMFRIKRKLDPTAKLDSEVNDLINTTAESAELHLLLAEIEFNNGNLVDAERKTQKSLTINPDFADAYYLQSEILEMQNDPYGADWSLKKALDLAPTNLEIRLKYVRKLLKSNNWLEADGVMNQYGLDSQNPEVIFLKGVIAKEKGNYPLAEQLFQKAKKRQYSVEIEVQLAEIEIRKSKYSEAEKRLLRIDTFYPANMEVALVKADLLLKQKNDKPIPSLLEPFLNNNSGNGRVHLVLAESHVQLGEIEKGIQVLEHGIKKWPRNPDLVRDYTFYLGITNKHEKAISLLEEMQTFKHKHNKLFYYRLREYYFKAGDQDKFRRYIYNHDKVQ